MEVVIDSRFDPFEVNQEAAQRGDHSRKEAFRKHARIWLADDQMRSGRAAARCMRRETAGEARLALEHAFRNAHSWNETAEMEVVPGQGLLCDIMRNSGMLVKTGYRVQGHMFVLREVLNRTGVKRVQLSMDQHRSTLAAFLCAFREEVARGSAHAFFVDYAKECLIDERNRIFRETRKQMDDWDRTTGRSGLR